MSFGEVDLVVEQPAELNVDNIDNLAANLDGDDNQQ